MVEKLIEGLLSKEAAERKAAAEALGKLGPDAKAACESLVDTLVDDSPQVQFAALEALEKIGLSADSAFMFVEEIFYSDDETHFAYVVALKALGLYGDRALELIREWVLHSDPVVRLVAIRFLKFISVDPSVELPILMELIKTESDEMNMEILLERVEQLSMEATTSVVASVDDILTPDNPIRKIIEFLGRLSIPQATAALEQLLNSKHDSWRLRAAIVLQQRNPHAQAISTLNALKDAYPDDDIGATAALYLRRAGR